jgi:hypothetical protein
MKATELYKEIQQYCRANTDEAVVKKYSRYFMTDNERVVHQDLGWFLQDAWKI